MGVYRFSVTGTIDQDTREKALDLIDIVLRDIGCDGMRLMVDNITEVSWSMILDKEPICLTCKEGSAHKSPAHTDHLLLSLKKTQTN